MANQHQPTAEQPNLEAWVNTVMEQAQVFASAWSLVGGRFDTGFALTDAEQAKAELRAMLYSRPPPTPEQTPPSGWDDTRARKHWAKRYQQEHHARLQLVEQLDKTAAMLVSFLPSSTPAQPTDGQIKEAVRPLYHSPMQASMSAEHDVEVVRAVERHLTALKNQSQPEQKPPLDNKGES